MGLDAELKSRQLQSDEDNASPQGSVGVPSAATPGSTVKPSTAASTVSSILAVTKVAAAATNSTGASAGSASARPAPPLQCWPWYCWRHSLLCCDNAQQMHNAHLLSAILVMFCSEMIVNTNGPERRTYYTCTANVQNNHDMHLC